ncbi:MAG TPA: GNAT family N-acetyltransferase, partial [Thermoanaerobaculia bacterium]|nr:GNAT family N-acetyltransferase [Thermoanaerobaculia bacterium]
QSMRLPRVQESSSAARIVARALAERGWRVATVTTEICPFIDLQGLSFDQYLETLGSSHRYNFRRRLRNLTRDFDVRFEHAETDAQRQEALSSVVDLHLKRWTERGGSDAFNATEVLAFHQELSRLALDRGWLRLMVLRLDGRSAAAFYGFRYGARVLFYQSGFDPELVRHSVGLVLIGTSIRNAIAEGAAEYDMLHGDETYKFLWAHQVRQLVRFDAYPPGYGGRAHHQAARFTAASRKFAKRLFQ